MNEAGNWPWYVLASGVTGVIVGYGLAVAIWKARSTWGPCPKICPTHGKYCDRGSSDHDGSHHCPEGHDF